MKWECKAHWIDGLYGHIWDWALEKDGIRVAGTSATERRAYRHAKRAWKRVKKLRAVGQ